MPGDGARLEQRADGYVRWRAWDPAEKRERYVYVHQLLAIADGASPYLVFSDGEWEVHHRNGRKFDNRTENLQLLPNDDHGATTSAREYEPAEPEGTA